MNEEMKNEEKVQAEETVKTEEVKTEECKCDGDHKCEGNCECESKCTCCGESEIDLSGKLQFNMSSGETYYVDSESLNMDELCAHVDDVKNNALSIRQMMIDLVMNPDNDELIDTIYNSLTQFADGIGISLKYEPLYKVNPNMSKRELCIIAAYDMTNVVDVILKHIEINNLISSLINVASDGDSNENPFTSEEFEMHLEEMNKVIDLMSNAAENDQAIPSPEEFEKQMQDIVEKCDNDTEVCHGNLDEAMMELLKKLGYGAAVKVFDDAAKWYA